MDPFYTQVHVHIDSAVRQECKKHFANYFLVCTKQNGKDNYMKMVQVKKTVGHFKLKFWTLFWGQDERGWPLVIIQLINYIKWL